MEHRKGKQPIMSSDTRSQCLKWLDLHREDIRFARKGYFPKVKAALEADTQIPLTDTQFKGVLTLFRRTYNCPIEYVENKYYIRHRKDYGNSNYSV